MNITFFIGNGFDINIGLATQYSKFYPYFIKNASDNNMIKSWLDGNEKLWSDLEEKLGQEISKIPEGKLDKFYDDKDELDRFLIEYLEKEQEKYGFEDPEAIKKEFSKSMLNFFNELSVEDVASIEKTMELYRDEDFMYSYITFNYTNILDGIIDLYDEKAAVIATHQGKGFTRHNRISQIIHIHGTTEEEMILGVNDVEQIGNDLLKDEEIFLDTFIKRRMNNSIGQRKTERAFDIINKSHIICVFGMSIGNTDKMWWEALVEWLVSNENNKLVIFWKGFEDALKKKLPSKMIRLNESIKRKVFDKGRGKYDDSYYGKIKSRIMISYNSKIFSLPKLKDDVTEKISE